ncbi:MAG: cryptochrome/photolyase family protein [Acidobacteriota bacterium]|jgi:deoxyribodipyrimidine photolyase-related protein
MSDTERRLDAGRRLRRARHLLVVLGDQLDPSLPAQAGLDRERDVILMMEAAAEAEHVPSHRQRTTLFLAAMRHFALDRIERGDRVRYVRLDDPSNRGTLGAELRRALRALRPEGVRVVQPGEHRVAADLAATCDDAGVPLQVLPDRSFTCSLEAFDTWAEGRKNLVMEHFYRWRRRELGILVAPGAKPVGGTWNHDRQNRESFRDPPAIPSPYRPRPDPVTREVMDLVERTWPDAPGRMERFEWPVTRREARRALRDFIDNRLHAFGAYEDAMWAGQPFLYHSLLSAPLNLKLLGPEECVEAALEAFAARKLEIRNVEGFVRQLIGWREFIRGVYHREGPSYPSRNALEQGGRLPGFYWSGDTRMRCLRHCVGEVLERGYGHHIPRLMVIGNFALIAGVDPGQVHRWFLSMYVDAVEWATAPNVIGMSQHADGGIVGTKPYAGSGKYIRRMSNYCDKCPYDPDRRTGEGACPFNTFYWEFLLRHEKRFAGNNRMALSLRNLARLSRGERREIRQDADRLRREHGID